VNVLEVGVPLNVQPDGAVTVKPVMAYALLDGLATDIVSPVVAVPRSTFGDTENVGGEELEANTGAATGIRNSIPDTASSASISPELNFLRYAFVGVFILYFREGLLAG
jgi:hypothetical protein